jgi:cytochrome b subunit of formate dehydrogenase
MNGERIEIFDLWFYAIIIVATLLLITGVVLRLHGVWDGF